MNQLMIGDVAPDFTTKNTTQGYFNLHDYKKGKWTLFCSHPADFTPICDGELCTMENWKDRFDKLNTVLIGLSVDTMESHEKWLAQFEEIDNLKFSFPIIADGDRTISKLYGMIRDDHELSKTVRSCFVIDQNNIVRATITYPAEVGRNFIEIIRLITALQLATKFPIATPVNWEPGADVVIHPKFDKSKYTEQFGEFKEVKPYLFRVKQPM